MQMPSPANNDYLALVRLGSAQPHDPRAARVAVLGFSTTHYYTLVLRGLGATCGFPLETYEPEYNTVPQAVLDDASPLYAFAPQFAVFVTAVQSLREILLAVPRAERVAVADREAEQLLLLIRRVSEIPGITVVVNEFVMPYERPWGNHTNRVDAALPAVVQAVNQRLRELARERANVFLVDCDHVASWIGKRAWFDERLWFHSKSFCHLEALPSVAGQALDIFRAVRGRTVKCIALDLDNVLWGGVIGEDGLDGIRLGALGEGEAFVHFQRWLKELLARGIILAVCSKNDEHKALSPFREHTDMILREQDISCFVANWHDKAANVRIVAERLNIGLDSILFLDDSPFERNLVRELVPEVCVPELPEDPADFVPYLESLNLFETTQFSEEDTKRVELYRANTQRHAAQQAFGSVDDYLASLESEAGFERFDDHHQPRIAQLVQRTNQFNLTTIRHSPEELRQFALDPEILPFYVTLRDRFGDNGLVSVVIGRQQDGRLDVVTWLMSCRVVARRLEEFVLDQLVEVARESGICTIRGRYVPTKKNALVAEHYARLGFRLVDTLTDGSTTWDLAIADHVPSGAPIARRMLQLES